jgi:hypothetical protein
MYLGSQEHNLGLWRKLDLDQKEMDALFCGWCFCVLWANNVFSLHWLILFLMVFYHWNYCSKWHPQVIEVYRRGMVSFNASPI